MANLTAKLIEVTRIGMENAGIFDIPDRFFPEPGQYLPCQHLSGIPEFQVINLFAVAGRDKALNLGALPENWSPGDWVAYHPPQGHGFKLPSSARRVGLLAMGVSPARLLTLVKPALAQDAAVSLFYDSQPDFNILDWVPPVVEAAPVSSLAENLEWPDFLAVDLERQDLAALSDLLGALDQPLDGQVLVQTPMPCRGLGECGVCAVKTRNGWRLACAEGPVFPLREVLHVAQ